MQAIEFAQVEVRVVEGLKAGNRILRELQEEVRVDDVEKLMDDTAEAIAYQNVQGLTIFAVSYSFLGIVSINFG